MTVVRAKLTSILTISYASIEMIIIIFSSSNMQMFTNKLAHSPTHKLFPHRFVSKTTVMIWCCVSK